MLGTITILFALCSALWAAELSDDIMIILRMVNGENKFRVRSIFNALALINVSVP